MTAAKDLDAAVARYLSQTKPLAVTAHDKFRNRLAVFVIGAFVGSLPFLIFKVIPPDNKETIVYILGQISGMATTVMGFYFVSSSTAGALDTKRADNTSKVIDMAAAAISSATSTEPQSVRVDQPINQPIPVHEQ